MTNWNAATPIAVDDLPATITAYLAAHTVRELDAAMPLYAPDATVTDDGQTYATPEAIRGWLGSAASEYTYTTELTGAAKVDNAHYDATHHLEGDFPGGVADLHFRFTLENDLIKQLVIEA